MANGEVDPISVKDAIVQKQRTLAPGFILIRQGLVQSAHCTRAGSDSRQFFSNVANFMSTRSTDKHLSEGFCNFWFITTIPLKHLGLEVSFSISGDAKIFNAPGLRDQISCVRAIALSCSRRRTFSPRRSQTLLQFLAHDFFNQNPHRTDCQVAHVLAKILFSWHVLVG